MLRTFEIKDHTYGVVSTINWEEKVEQAAKKIVGLRDTKRERVAQALKSNVSVEEFTKIIEE